MCAARCASQALTLSSLLVSEVCHLHRFSHATLPRLSHCTLHRERPSKVNQLRAFIAKCGGEASKQSRKADLASTLVKLLFPDLPEEDQAAMLKFKPTPTQGTRSGNKST